MESAGFPVRSVWFNAWLYSREQALWRALIACVLEGVRALPGLDDGSLDDLRWLEARLYSPVAPSGGRVRLRPGCLPGLDGGPLPTLTGLELVRRRAEREKGRAAAGSLQEIIADAPTCELPVERFDCIVSIAAMHHLPLERTLSKMKRALRSGGALVILDLFEVATLGDLFVSAVASVAGPLFRLQRTGRLREPREHRDAWAAHAPNDAYPTLAGVRRLCARHLPGARVRRHLLWRYSLVWHRDVHLPPASI
jgi:SAM-dependent methyltransferase